MRVMVIVKGNKDTEAGVMPTKQQLTDMGNFNERLVNAGMMLAGEGLHPTSKGARINFDGAKPKVIDGPFSETKELIAGYWVLKVKSLQDAIDWLKQAPFEEGDIEIRPIFEAEDFGAEFTPELRAQEDRHRQKSEELAKGKKG